MIDRYDPFRQTMSLRQMMDRLLEDAFISPRTLSQQMGDSGPAMDVYEEGDNLVVEARLPGMKPEDIDVTVEQGVLTISGQTHEQQERKDRNYLVREQRSGSFTRTIRLPSTINPEACQASYENGVLRLTFAKSEQAKAKRIPVSSGTSRTIEGQTSGRQTSGGQSGGQMSSGQASGSQMSGSQSSSGHSSSGHSSSGHSSSGQTSREQSGGGSTSR